MTKINLRKRLTHKYANGWDYLDEFDDIGTARALGQKTTREDGESKTTLGLFLVSSKESPEDVKRSLYDTLGHSCRCEHDCCGHWQTSVSKVRHLSKGLYAVRCSHYRNC
jgi:hypothetical protein